MAYGFTAEDMVAICLTLADGDLSTPLGEVIRRAEALQAGTQRHFGVSDADFLNSFFQLKTADTHQTFEEFIEDFQRSLSYPLSWWLPQILDHYMVYFNDEGESWERLGEPRSSGPPDHRDLVHRFLEEIKDFSPARCLESLERLDWPVEALFFCMEGGWRGDEASWPGSQGYPPNCIPSRLGRALNRENRRA
ncbi:MAG: hypothetical protein KKA60_10095 [Proteobacteria bacterium]|nr:hypothetical protein [Pseudomonadota bacterium]